MNGSLWGTLAGIWTGAPLPERQLQAVGNALRRRECQRDDSGVRSRQLPGGADVSEQRAGAEALGSLEIDTTM